ncbi:MAG: hypothetical protein L6Q94_19020 [Calditrichia bacterium]|nr:hypothetical protein [Calditrichia bacterium]
MKIHLDDFIVPSTYPSDNLAIPSTPIPALNIGIIQKIKKGIFKKILKRVLMPDGGFWKQKWISNTRAHPVSDIRIAFFATFVIFCL